MSAKKIYLLLAHPDPDDFDNTFSGTIANTYEEAAREAGHKVVRCNLGQLNFDPILHKGYKTIQELEPDLQAVQKDIQWADHVVIIYPNWWNTMPALLKGMFDRMWLPGFAFNFDKVQQRLIQKLTNKTGRVIIISGTYSPWRIRWLYGDFKNEIQRGILQFAGIKTKATTFGPCEHASEEEKNVWLEEVTFLGRKGI